MTWIYLVVAGILEVVWATALKMSQGFSQLGASIVTVVGMILSFVFLGLAVKHLPLSLAYPIWTGIGAVGSILVGVICFRDRLPAITWLFRAFRLCSSRTTHSHVPKKAQTGISSACAPKLIYKVPRGLPSLKARKIGRLRRGVRFRD